MRPLLAVLVLGAASIASADRLILSPTGRKVPFGTARLEHLFDQTDHSRSRTMLAVGLTEALDAELVFEQGEGKGEVFSFDVSYNLFPALTNITPGLSVGVRDGVGKTRDGRGLYLATTYKIGLTGAFNGDVPAEISHGYLVGDHSGYFIGVMIPFRNELRILAEYDSQRLNAGIEFRPLKDVWTRWIHRHNQSFWSVTLVQRF